MRRANLPFLADLTAISLRWLLLLGVSSWLGWIKQLSVWVVVVLLILTLWNLLLSVLAIFNIRINQHRLINILVDIAGSTCLFIFTGGLEGGLAWVGILPVLTSAIYYEWLGSLLSTVGFTFLQILWTVITSGNNILLKGGAILSQALINLSFGVVAGLASWGVMSVLRREYQHMVMQQRDVERRVQKVERDRSRTLYNMVEALSATLNFNVVLESALDLSAEVLGDQSEHAGRVVSAVLLFGEKNLRVGAARHLPPTDMRRNLPAASGILHEVVSTSNPKVIENPSQDPELRSFVALQSCKSALCLPLRRGLNAFGVMLFAHPNQNFFTVDRIDILEMISHQAVVAIQNASLYRDLELEKERIIETQDEARKKLARDLHDGPTQSVAAIAMRLSVIRMLLEKDPTSVEEELAKVEDLARRTTQEIRHMLFTLRPLVLESEGLKAALKAIADKMRDTFQQKVEVDVDEAVVEQLEIGKQTVIFYLVEEALTNARKHAKASIITVRLKFLPRDTSLALLEIEDNGAGFDVNAVNKEYEKRGSLGMVNLRERTELISGLLNIDSTPGKGTNVQIAIPLNEEATNRLHHNQ